MNDKLKKYGFTVMDGPFFSIMPFGKTGFHFLTSVTFTPHTASYDEVPLFSCQKESGGYCNTKHLGNCNNCEAQLASAFPYMEKLAKKYLKDEYVFSYKSLLYSMKPILIKSDGISLDNKNYLIIWDSDEVIDAFLKENGLEAYSGMERIVIQL